MIQELELPASYQRDLRRAIEILKGVGCTAIYLFGSLARGRLHEGSDIDLAIRGCPPNRFFRALGNLLTELDHSVDLIDLDCEDPIAKYLERKGKLVQIA
ncbi:MAG: nucleotidyltransferase domain-containing protein [bacterium]|nr:nucleotidyltransferase domain-containing protein [bacterium]